MSSMEADHASVIRSHTPERYILGELPPQEREEFESHLADCRVCMREIEAMDIFAANVSAVFADEARQKGSVAKPWGWFEFLRPRAFPVLVFSGVLNLTLLICAGVGVSRLATPSQPHSGISEVFTVRPPARSGQGQICPVTRNSIFATFRLDLPQTFRRYSYSLEGAGQNSVDAAKVGQSETLNLTVSVAGLKAGDHRFEVTGFDGQTEKLIGECLLRVEPGR